MELVFDPYTGKMVDRQTGLPMEMPPGYVPERVSTLDQVFNGTGIPERINALHSMFNPVTALGEAGQHSQNMLAPGRAPMQRVSDLGQVLTGMAGTVAPMVAASRGAVPAANALVDGLTGFNPASAPALFMADEFGGVKIPGAKEGITAYHGSPHSFDRFSMDKIGTGEGAQAYGHGLYFAENEGVAKAYRDTLSQSQIAVDGANKARGDIWYELANVVKAADPNLRQSQADQIARNMLDDVTQYGSIDKALKKVDLPGGQFEPAYRAAADWLKEKKASVSKGSMYEVRINANPDDFLDWDKPLSEQPAKVREALGPLAETARREKYITGVNSGEDLYRGAVDGMMFDRKQIGLVAEKNAKDDIARLASERGIPGIKYLDAGSRGAGDGSRNYVVFDERLIEIVRKYGIAGAAAMLGVTAADVEQAMAGPRQ